jgi:hypothetical protein
MGDVGSTGVLPVKVEAIKVVVLEVLDDVGGEGPAAVGRHSVAEDGEAVLGKC